MSFSCFLVSFGKVILSRDVPGQRSLSRDFCSCPCPGKKGQVGQGNIFVPGQRDTSGQEFFLSWDKGTMGQAQNLAKGWDGPGQPVKIQDRTRDKTVPDFDSLSRTIPRDKTGQSRKGRFKTGKDVLRQKKTF